MKMEITLTLRVSKSLWAKQLPEEATYDDVLDDIVETVADAAQDACNLFGTGHIINTHYAIQEEE